MGHGDLKPKASYHFVEQAHPYINIDILSRPRWWMDAPSDLRVTAKKIKAGRQVTISAGRVATSQVIKTKLGMGADPGNIVTSARFGVHRPRGFGSDVGQC
jgi:hypothetical protein